MSIWFTKSSKAQKLSLLSYDASGPKLVNVSPLTHLGPHNSDIQIDRANIHAQDPREAIPWALEAGNHPIQAPK